MKVGGIYVLLHVHVVYTIQQAGFFKLIQNDHKLPGYIIQQKMVDSKAECAQLCITRNCFSFNIDNDNMNEKLCEVNSESLQFQGTSLTPQTGSDHYQKVPDIFNVHAVWYHGNTGNIYALTDDRIVYIYADENSLHKPPMQVTDLDNMLPSLTTNEIHDIQFMYAPTINFTRVFEGANIWLYEKDLPKTSPNYFPKAASFVYGVGIPAAPDAVFMTASAYFVKDNIIFISNGSVIDSYDITDPNPTKEFQNVPVINGITSATETGTTGVFLFFENSAFIRYDTATKLYTKSRLHGPQ
ncbi:unnamed protein product [Owenia fusiformis]|uniref:Uncharacterized protein n=1 Tax=Owenia fusiformis TaxID=6347 RepID=A0A8J1UPE0_OWEFU|nr:unnamed protein product [Owenia fusiformis]